MPLLCHYSSRKGRQASNDSQKDKHTGYREDTKNHSFSIFSKSKIARANASCGMCLKLGTLPSVAELQLWGVARSCYAWRIEVRIPVRKGDMLWHAVTCCDFLSFSESMDHGENKTDAWVKKQWKVVDSGTWWTCVFHNGRMCSAVCTLLASAIAGTAWREAPRSTSQHIKSWNEIATKYIKINPPAPKVKGRDHPDGISQLRFRFTWGGGWHFWKKSPVFDRSWRSPSKNTVKNSTE